MLLAHDLLLLLLDARSGRMHASNVARELLGGAVLVQLADGGWVDVAGGGETVRAGRLVCRPVPPPADPTLAAALARLSERQGKRPEQVLRPLGDGLPYALADDLVTAGLVRAEQRRTLGVFPTWRHPPVAGGYERQLRDRLAAVVAGTLAPDARTGPLLALLGASGALAGVLPQVSNRQARRIARQMAAADWASASVRRAVQAANSAATAAVTAAATT